MIEIDGLVKRYGAVLAVDGVTFTVERGEVVALLGPNGAGKSTTIKSVTGLVRPTSGRVRVDGHDVVRAGTRAKASLGYVPDRPYLYPKLTGRELLRFVGRLRSVRDAERVADTWLETFGLLGAANALIETYSHGMRQKLTFVAALMHDPAALVIDEPMVGLDPRAARQVRAIMRDHADRGRAVLLTTHSMEVAEAVADRVLVMHAARVVASGTMAELRRTTGQHDADLEAIFLRLTDEAERLPDAFGDPLRERDAVS
ncbi:MAG: ABC transporter ATP-binding protein [Trueperaceae bacterium]|nr:ABC transporter ATP-binding protein [Trueperaceae bacterium]